MSTNANTVNTNTNNWGTVRICRVQNLGRIHADIKMAAVQSMANPKDTITIATELAPSDAVLTMKNKAKENGTWNEDYFRNEYVPAYIAGLTDDKARQTLNKIYKAVKAGKTVAIACYCADETTCHRSVIAGLMQSLGLNVAGVKGDYSGYHAQWKAAMEAEQAKRCA